MGDEPELDDPGGRDTSRRHTFVSILGRDSSGSHQNRSLPKDALLEDNIGLADVSKRTKGALCAVKPYSSYIPTAWGGGRDMSNCIMRSVTSRN